VGGDLASTGVSRITEIDVATLTDFLGSHPPFDVLESDELSRYVPNVQGAAVGRACPKLCL
jgi:hypothetical protein